MANLNSILNGSQINPSGLVLGQSIFGGGNLRVYATAGSSTFVVPTNVYQIRVRVHGAGGSGGLALGGNTTNVAATGGGGGGFAMKVVSVTPGTSYAVTVGAGGAGLSISSTTVRSNGNAGGTSSFGAVCSATGGAGGTWSITTGGNLSGVAGGTGSGGDVNYTGGSSGSITGIQTYALATGGGCGATIIGDGGAGGNIINSGAYTGHAFATGGGGAGGSGGNYTTPTNNRKLGTGGGGVLATIQSGSNGATGRDYLGNLLPYGLQSTVTNANTYYNQSLLIGVNPRFAGDAIISAGGITTSVDYSYSASGGWGGGAAGTYTNAAGQNSVAMYSVVYGGQGGTACDNNANAISFGAVPINGNCGGGGGTAAYNSSAGSATTAGGDGLVIVEW